ncbi:phosphodiesterase [Rhodococcus sp. PAMC28707]|uniref:phosphodiesterase n=1 Tax=unclassified Rhodococcus (in: high G+C Gram-positive bacteria) TaxID=192944 RepID=UPI00109DA8E6|nr:MULTISPECIES: phosphodiesterase [unclassified Rhodococcus (in: high G+C Gram-positive bacteria)]QCB52168.1 phosphodiesterase [Rhodococcus sp. PAMC28705]QCB59662.1 phosphodiesterase [Rhodococcus sp. PAMC28707]
MKSRTAEYPRPNHCLLHLSDTHLVEGGDLYGGVDSTATLRRILADVETSGVRPDALVFTGDLTDRGEPGAYDTLRALVEPVAEALGARIIWAMGNHDDRATFRSRLLDQAPTTGTVDRVHEVAGLRIITLDSTVPGHHYGEVTQSQLDWLAGILETKAEFGTILAMHHPPVPAVLDLAVLVELLDQRSLADALRGSDVRSILAGHLHYSTSATFAGIPVSVASATCYTQDLNVPPGATRGRDGAQAYNLVHLYDDNVVHSVVPIGTYETVGEYVSAEEVVRRLDEAGVTIAESTRRPRFSSI